MSLERQSKVQRKEGEAAISDWLSREEDECQRGRLLSLKQGGATLERQKLSERNNREIMLTRKSSKNVWNFGSTPLC